MGANQSEKLDDVASGLDDLQTTVEELQEDPPSGADRADLNRLKEKIEKARDVADDLEDESR